MSSSKLTNTSFLVDAYQSGAIGHITALHGNYYSKHWQFTPYFEAKVASELAAYIQHFQANRDGIWLIVQDNQVQGSIIIDGTKAHTEGAHLRWFILSEAIQGKGFGKLLISKAIDFCKEKKYPRVYLWTFQGLNSARFLYEKSGFQLTHTQEGTQWGTKVLEQRFELSL